MPKIQRNEKCPCGSDIKFKKCCYLRGINNHEDILQLKNIILNHPISNNEVPIADDLLIGNPIISASLNGSRAVAVGGGLYIRNRLETFHEFLIHQLKHGLGWTWGGVESQKPLDERHIYLRWLNSFAEQVNKESDNEHKLADHLYSTNPQGNTQALLTYAWDIFTLRNAKSALPNRKIRELRDWRKFQGARYEVGVAALFVRAGFTIEWLEDRVIYPHGEFIATHRLTNEKVVVEVKSKHRSGVIHEPGAQTQTTKSGIQGLFNEAVMQIENYIIPSIIFIDLNVPMDNETAVFDKGWTKYALDIFKDKPIPTAENPESPTMTVITNYSWHYLQEAVVGRTTNSVYVISMFPRKKLSKTVIDLLVRAVNEVGKTPVNVF